MSYWTKPDYRLLIIQWLVRGHAQRSNNYQIRRIPETIHGSSPLWQQADAKERLRKRCFAKTSNKLKLERCLQTRCFVVDRFRNKSIFAPFRPFLGKTNQDLSERDRKTCVRTSFTHERLKCLQKPRGKQLQSRNAVFSFVKKNMGDRSGAQLTRVSGLVAFLGCWITIIFIQPKVKIAYL